ncbi:hypothetical protein [Arthrobacter sp.]|uniref:hypothetical protein n=1 Tax=Arthrobacter sp. TaxID=1667 RepID=UPI00339430F2
MDLIQSYLRAAARPDWGAKTRAFELWKALTRDAYAHVDRYMRETAVRIRD